MVPIRSISALALAALFALPAQADTRTTNFATFMHVGPGTRYAVIDEVPTHTRLEVAACRDGWCEIRYGAAIGWIAERIVAAPTAGPASGPSRPASADCVDFARTGWPNAGDPNRLCLQAPNPPAR